MKGNSRLFIITGVSCGIGQSARCAVPFFGYVFAYSISKDSAKRFGLDMISKVRERSKAS